MRLVILFALFLAACSSAPQSLIIGKWEAQGTPVKMTGEFHKDGTATISVMGGTMRANYKLTSNNELEWTMNGMSTKNKVKVTADELEITDEVHTIKYKRM